MVAGDDILSEFYIDGVSQTPSGGWPSSRPVGPVVIPSRARILAFKVTNTANSAGLLASSADSSILSGYS